MLLKKELIPGLRQGKYKMNLEHSVISGIKKVSQKMGIHQRNKKGNLKELPLDKTENI